MSITCVNGGNQNVVLPPEGVVYAISGPTANFAIGGITGGAPGRHLILINNTGFTMTLNNEDAGSTAANRIRFGGANKTVNNTGKADLHYYSPSSRWYVT